MDLFSFATNIQQMALGGVNFVNKFRKKQLNANSNYVTYYVIGEDETNPNDRNIFFLPFSNVDKLKFSEFKEYFPFKENVIFRFRIAIKDLVDVINEAFQNDLPLLKKKGDHEQKTESNDSLKGSLLNNHIKEEGKKEMEKERKGSKTKNGSRAGSGSASGKIEKETTNLSEYIISDETEIKNITKQENGNYVWIDITNDDAYIPLCQGKIVAKVLFINRENYKNYDQIYFREFNSEQTNIYNVNEKHLCSYFVEHQEHKGATDNKETNNQDRKEALKKEKVMKENKEIATDDNTSKEKSSRTNNATLFYSTNTDYDVNHMEEEDVSKKEKNRLSGFGSSCSIFKIEEIKSNVGANEATNNSFISHKSTIQSDTQKRENVGGIEHNETEVKQKRRDSENREKERMNKRKHEKKLPFFQNGELNDENTNKSFIISSEITQISQKKTPKDSSNSNTLDTSDRLKEIKELRCEEEKKIKERMLITNKIKKQIDKWSKNSDDTYKDIKVMLSTLHGVLWENCDWKPVSMSELMSNPKLAKTCYKSAIILCHPDKQRNKPLAQMLRAELIFQALNNSFKAKKNI